MKHSSKQEARLTVVSLIHSLHAGYFCIFVVVVFLLMFFFQIKLNIFQEYHLVCNMPTFIIMLMMTSGPNKCMLLYTFCLHVACCYTVVSLQFDIQHDNVMKYSQIANIFRMLFYSSFPLI